MVISHVPFFYLDIFLVEELTFVVIPDISTLAFRWTLRLKMFCCQWVAVPMRK